jgi:hypothetical protein
MVNGIFGSFLGQNWQLQIGRDIIDTSMLRVAAHNGLVHFAHPSLIVNLGPDATISRLYAFPASVRIDTSDGSIFGSRIA